MKVLLEVYDHTEWDRPVLVGRVASDVNLETGEISAIHFPSVVGNTLIRLACAWGLFQKARKAWLN